MTVSAKCHTRELVESIKRSEASPETPDKYDGGLYVGRAGIAYMLWFVGTKQPDLAHNLESARELALAHYRWRGFSWLCSSDLSPSRFCVQQDHHDQASRLGFLLGNTGVYAGTFDSFLSLCDLCLLQ